MWQRYNRVDTLDKLRQLDQFLFDGEKRRYDLISYDTETNGLRLYKNTIVGFSLSVDRHMGWYVPLLDWVPDTSSLKKKTKKGTKYEIYEHGEFRCVWTGKTYPEDITHKDYEMPPFIPALLNNRSML